MKSGFKSPNNKLKLREALTYVIPKVHEGEVVVLCDLHTLWIKRRQSRLYPGINQHQCAVLSRRARLRSGNKGKSH